MTVAHNVLGGTSGFSGRLSANTGVGSVSIAGSLLGGSGVSSAQIFAAAGGIGAVKIGHNIAGGAGDESGKIDSAGKLASVTIRGSLVGGSGDQDTTTRDGQIFAGGDIGSVKIRHDVAGGSGKYSASIASEGAVFGVTLGGSLVGRSRFFSGAIVARDLGAVKIGRDLLGGTGGGGYMEGFDSVAGVTIGGSLVGGASNFDGAVVSLGAGGLGAVKVGHDVLGGSGADSGAFKVAMKIASVSIGGSLVGGSKLRSGAIFGGDLGPVKIGRDLVGGSIAGATATLDQTGYIEASGRVASISIGGSIIAGIDGSTGGALTKNGSIRAGDDIGALRVKGSLIGNVAPNGTSLVVISARGQAVPVGGKDVSIGKITVGGSVERVNILAGYTTDLVASNDGVQIGAVSVGRDWIASNVVAGVQNFGADGLPGGTGAAADNVNYGDAFDVAIGTGGITSRIASIVIRGTVVGSAVGGDHFGFSAGEIGSFQALNFTAPLTPRSDVIDLSPITDDVTIRET